MSARAKRGTHAPKEPTDAASDAAVDLPTVRRALLAWYDENKRDLPWRRTRDPYEIWVAEVMLQQTRVETAIPYYARFLAKFPDVAALAAAPIDDVLATWSGLGYYRRARLLHRGAQFVRERHSGVVPASVDGLAEIPGVGRYTTGAIASCAFGLEAALVDGNVARFFSRLFAIDDDVKKSAGLRRVWSLAEALITGERPDALNNALMELGATVCVPREPRCLLCPVRAHCLARSRGIERQLPRATAKAVRPTVREQALLLTLRGAKEKGVLLARCADGGLFAGLWEPPRVGRAPRSTLEARAYRLLGVIPAIAPRAVRDVRHVLTHKTLEVAVFEGEIDAPPTELAGGGYDAFEVVAPERLSTLGISTLARKVLGER